MNQSQHDLHQDFNRLLKLAQSARVRLKAYIHNIQKAGNQYLPNVADVLLDESKHLDQKFESLETQIKQAVHSEQKVALSHELRILYSLLGSTLSMSDWQAPGFETSKTLLMGQQKPHVTPHYRDYKRDRHHNGVLYQKKFVKEYIDKQLHRSPEAFVFSSGQSAFTTVALNVRSRILPGDKIFVGRGTYFENMFILTRMFNEKIVFFDEMDIDQLKQLVVMYKPRAVFVDTLSNTLGMPALNIQRFTKEVLPMLQWDSYLVFDNTLLATSFQPLMQLPLFGHIRYYVVESLMKYHQFGMDRVTGGVVTCSEIDGISLMRQRIHYGTMMSDACVEMLPTPDRKMFDARLARLQRNTVYLSRLVYEHLMKHPHRHISHVVHPQLPNHPAYEWSKDAKFMGSSFSFVFKKGHEHYFIYRMIMNRVFRAAKRAGVMISGGTSFGYDATRIYLTARFASVNVTPFLRISPGTETQEEIEKLGEVLIRALS